MRAEMTMEEAVWVDPDRMSGAPCFRGSRLPVQHLFDWLADGVPLDEFVEEFRIDRRAAEAVLRAAGAELSRRHDGAGPDARRSAATSVFLRRAVPGH